MIADSASQGNGRRSVSFDPVLPTASQDWECKRLCCKYSFASQERVGSISYKRWLGIWHLSAVTTDWADDEVLYRVFTPKRYMHEYTREEGVDGK